METSVGTKHVWTTFSADQVDLNYENPDVLLRMIDVLLLYVQQGATLIRLDAVAFLWKEIGGTSIHCAETHCVVKLLRTILDAVAPDVLLITETNVPHEENISYFGDGTDEAQLVYQFPLPPLVVDAFLVASAESLRSWAESLRPPPGEATFFNFLASHDGIGLRPLEGLVPPSRVKAMVDRTIQHGGRVSYKHDSNGQQSAYELNISFFDALNNPAGREPLDLQVRKFLTAQAIMLSLAGVPGIYFHSLFGSRSWREGMEERGNRAINREKLDRRSLMTELEDPTSLRSKVFTGYSRLLSIRSSHDAFHPNTAQRVIRAGEGVFGVLRGGGATRPVLCLHNVTSRASTLRITPDDMGLARTTGLHDLLSGAPYVIDEDDSATIPLPAYATVWLAEGDA